MLNIKKLKEKAAKLGGKINIFKPKAKEEDLFDELTKLKSKFRQLTKQLDVAVQENDKEKMAEIKSEIGKVAPAIMKVERNFIDVKRGLYVGVGVNFKDPTKKIIVYFQWGNLNNHLSVLGTTRVGKTKVMLSHVEQFIMNDWNLIVTDPKGGNGQEVFTALMGYCLQHKRPEDFEYISPVFPEMSLPFNPLFGMSNDEIPDLVKTLSDTGGDAFFSDFANYVTKAILLGLDAIEKFDNIDNINGKNKIEEIETEELLKYHALRSTRRGDIENFKEFFKKELSDEEFQDMKKKLKNRRTDIGKQFDKIEAFNREDRVSEPDTTEKNESFVSRTFITFKDLLEYSNKENLERISDKINEIEPTLVALVEKENQIIKTYSIEENFEPIKLTEAELKKEKLISLKNTIKEAKIMIGKLAIADKTYYDKIVTSLQVLFASLSTGAIGKILCTIKINPIRNRLAANKGLILLIQPAPLKFTIQAQMLVKILLKSFESFMGQIGATGRDLDRRIGMFLDEAGAILYPSIIELFNKAGGLGVTLSIYTQSYKDVEEKLGETNAAIMFDNINTNFRMRMNDISSQKRLVDEVGTVKKNIGNSSAQGLMVTQKEENILTTDKIRAMSIGRGIIMHNGNAYLTDFPFVGDPPIKPLIMPTLEEEKNINELIRKEAQIQDLLLNIQNNNKEKWDSFIEKRNFKNGVKK
jgi:hypothetical protein